MIAVLDPIYFDMSLIVALVVLVVVDIYFLTQFAFVFSELLRFRGVLCGSLDEVTSLIQQLKGNEINLGLARHYLGSRLERFERDDALRDISVSVNEYDVETQVLLRNVGMRCTQTVNGYLVFEFPEVDHA